jgi:cell division protein FtsA
MAAQSIDPGSTQGPLDRRSPKEGLKAALTSRPSVIAAVDLGASKVSCFVMKGDQARRADDVLTIAGVGYVQSKGIKGGVISDVDAVTESICMAVDIAESLSGLHIEGVTISMSGGGLASHRHEATVGLGSRPITDADCARATSQALANLRMPGRRVIHRLAVGWSVDGQKGIRDPRGLIGRNLKLDLLSISMNEMLVQTLANCVERAHLNFEGLVAAPLVSSIAALDEDERDLGSICIDMGGGSTSLSVFSAGSLVFVDSIPVGGQHVTQDIARGLSTSLSGAERVKTLHGSAIASSNEDREMIEAPPRGDDPGAGPVVAPRSLLKGIIAPRVEETLELLRDRLNEAQIVIEPGAGVVLTGGASQLAGVREVAVRVFDRPVRLGRPKRLPHLADAASGPAFCASAGTLQRITFGPHDQKEARSGIGGFQPRNGNEAGPLGVVDRVASWLRDNL